MKTFRLSKRLCDKEKNAHYPPLPRQDVHVPISRTCKYSTLHSRKDSAQMIKVTEFDMWSNPGLSSIKAGPIKSHKSLKAETLFQLCQQKREVWSMRGIQSTTDGFEDGRRGHKPRMWLASRGWKWSSADSQQENGNLCPITAMK